MFEHLKEYSIILVTGPQRSGTTICARMIEHDLGHTYIDEGWWGVWDGMKALKLAKDRRPCVLQGPGLLKDVERFIQLDNAAIVLMRRPVRDIIASQDRVGWNMWAEKEIDFYTKTLSKTARKAFRTSAREYVASIKYSWFDKFTRDKVRNLYEIQYESLRKHPMWVDKEHRKDFGAKQYE